MRIQCLGCKYKPNEHDALSGFCLTCADKRVRNYTKLLEACKYTQTLLAKGIGQHTHALAMLETALGEAGEIE